MTSRASANIAPELGTSTFLAISRFLGYLKENFEERSRCPGGAIDATCYTYGTAPDTILNFGWSRYPAYLEINNNGRLNLKINLDSTLALFPAT